MTSTNKNNYAEVLTNQIQGTTSKKTSDYTQSRLKGVLKYLFVSNMGAIDRIYGKVDAELTGAETYIKMMLQADCEADAKGGYGQGSQELVEEFGFQGGVQDMHIKIQDLVAVRSVIEEFFNSNNDDFEQMFGYKFSGQWIGKKEKQSVVAVTPAKLKQLKAEYGVA